MARDLLYYFLILIFGIPMHECVAVLRDGRCVIEEPCFDLSVMANSARLVSKDVVSILILLSAYSARTQIAHYSHTNNCIHLLQN